MPHEHEDPLLEQMKRWGRIKVSRSAANDEGYHTREHVLSKQSELGLATRRKQLDDRPLIGRDGEERRRFMALRSGVPKLQILPDWAVDPVRSRNDADAPHDRAPALVDLIPDELHWIDRALARMARDFPLREMILRVEFCEPGTHGRKASLVQAQYGGSVSIRQYRAELQRAMDWMRGRMAA